MARNDARMMQLSPAEERVQELSREINEHGASWGWKLPAHNIHLLARALVRRGWTKERHGETRSE